MANNPAGTKLGAASHHQILSLKVVLFRGGRSVESDLEMASQEKALAERGASYLRWAA